MNRVLSITSILFFLMVASFAQDCPLTNANELKKGLRFDKKVFSSYEVKKNNKREVKILATYKNGASIELTYGGCESFYTVFKLSGISLNKAFNIKSDTLPLFKKFLELTPFTDKDWKKNLLQSMGKFKQLKGKSTFSDLDEYVTKKIEIKHNKNKIKLTYRENIQLLF